jgi:hypothetical protein
VRRRLTADAPPPCRLPGHASGAATHSPAAPGPHPPAGSTAGVRPRAGAEAHRHQHARTCACSEMFCWMTWRRRRRSSWLSPNSRAGWPNRRRRRTASPSLMPSTSLGNALCTSSAAAATMELGASRAEACAGERSRQHNTLSLLTACLSECQAGLAGCAHLACGLRHGRALRLGRGRVETCQSRPHCKAVPHTQARHAPGQTRAPASPPQLPGARLRHRLRAPAGPPGGRTCARRTGSPWPCACAQSPPSAPPAGRRVAIQRARQRGKRQRHSVCARLSGATTWFDTHHVSRSATRPSVSRQRSRGCRCSPQRSAFLAGNATRDGRRSCHGGKEPRVPQEHLSGAMSKPMTGAAAGDRRQQFLAAVKSQA